jgi:hypothetical protein
MSLWLGTARRKHLHNSDANSDLAFRTDTETVLFLTAHFPSPSAGRVVSHADRGFDFVAAKNRTTQPSANDQAPRPLWGVGHHLSLRVP